MIRAYCSLSFLGVYCSCGGDGGGGPCPSCPCAPWQASKRHEPGPFPAESGSGGSSSVVRHCSACACTYRRTQLPPCALPPLPAHATTRPSLFVYKTRLRTRTTDLLPVPLSHTLSSCTPIVSIFASCSRLVAHCSESIDGCCYIVTDRTRNGKEASAGSGGSCWYTSTTLLYYSSTTTALSMMQNEEQAGVPCTTRHGWRARAGACMTTSWRGALADAMREHATSLVGQGISDMQAHAHLTRFHFPLHSHASISRAKRKARARDSGGV